MEITVKKNFGYELIFVAENVKIVEDIEVREYPLLEDGKTNFRVLPKRDIKTDTLVQFSAILSDMIYYREADFDSSDLIKQLFNKLPQDVANNLITSLNFDYAE